MPQETFIPGGYILIARKMLDSELMNKPPHYLKLWIWMLSKAFWKDGEQLQRGQLHTSIEEMQEVGTYRVGGRVEGKFTAAEVRSAYGYFKETGAILVSKRTRGMVISIINFDIYQNPSNYEQHTNPNSTPNNTPKRTQKNLLPTDIIIKSNHTTMPEQHAEQHAEQHTIDEECFYKKDYKKIYSLNQHSNVAAQALIDLWNEVAAESPLPKVLRSNKARNKNCTNRLQEYPLDTWRTIFTEITASPFLSGQNREGWRADFDWITGNDSNAIKVLEGKYSNHKGSGNSNTDSRYGMFAGAM